LPAKVRRVSLPDLFRETERQMSICNSCRYCAGYCPVWPALERRGSLLQGDMLHLANLCHDCRDCFSACMYTPPHEFGVNPPRVFSELRQETYETYVPRLPRINRRWALPLSGVLAFAAVMALTLAAPDKASRRGSPYAVVPHLLLIVLGVAPVVVSFALLGRGIRRYWRDIAPGVTLASARGWVDSLRNVATLRHMSGGGEGCEYESDDPGRARRWAHQAIMYGFLLTFVSTVSAWVTEAFIGREPPYGFVSVPVLTGTVGGVLASVGCVAMLVLKSASHKEHAAPRMNRADAALTWALLFLMLSGIAVLVVRDTVAFRAVLIVHLTAVVTAFAIFPFTKFVHFVFRVLSIYKDGVERRGLPAVPDPVGAR
jgi:citrate/tricarballylate utilization protein